MRIAFLQDQQVRYSVPVAVATAALTGTATSGWTETIVTTATRTIIITLTNTTWVASGATFDAQRQAILDGVISAQSESNGWNAKRPTIPVTAVVRTSNTVVTVTVPVIPTYVVSANETLTVTVPTAATLAGYPLVATPTLTIQNTSPSAVVSGTASSGWYESEVVAGGETVLLTLAGENWITAGTAFDAQRQAILDGIVSAQSEAAGWNAVRSSIPVTAVVRTSNTLVTITLPALGSYSVSANETLTVTIPSAALSGSGPIVASPALTVTDGSGGHIYFQDGFESGNLSSPTVADSGWSWGDANGDSGFVPVVSSTRAKNGTYSLKMPFRSGSDLTDSWCEQRFVMGSSLTAVYVRFWLWVPSNYAHRNSADTDNNKFFRIWSVSYGQVKLGCSMLYRNGSDAAQGSTLFMERANYSEPSMGAYDLPGYSSFITPADFGAWMRVQMYFKLDTGGGNARMTYWKNGTQILDSGNFANPAGPWGNTFTDGYILGWSNSGFNNLTEMFVDDVVFSDSPE